MQELATGCIADIATPIRLWASRSQKRYPGAGGCPRAPIRWHPMASASSGKFTTTHPRKGRPGAGLFNADVGVLTAAPELAKKGIPPKAFV